jgi:hypothetical protein
VFAGGAVDAGLVVLPCIVSHFCQTIIDAGIATWWGRRAAAAAAAAHDPAAAAAATAAPAPPMQAAAAGAGGAAAAPAAPPGLSPSAASANKALLAGAGATDVDTRPVAGEA